MSALVGASAPGAENKKLPKKRRSSSSLEKSHAVSIVNDSTINDSEVSEIRPSTPAIDMNTSSKTQEVYEDYKLGQLAWAQIGSYPFWPCIVSLDPETKIFQEEVNMDNKRYRCKYKIHINYFADNGRRGWVLTSNMLVFDSKQAFLRLCKQTVKPKTIKTRCGFVIKPQHLQKWEEAVKEAERYLPQSNNERLKMLAEELKQLANLANQRKKQKRKRSKSPQVVPLKKSKTDIQQTSTPTTSAKNLNFNFLTPESENSTPKRFKRPESRMSQRNIDKNQSLDSFLTKSVQPISRRTRSESRMSERIDAEDTKLSERIAEIGKTLEPEKEESKRPRRPESRMSSRIKVLEERKSLGSTSIDLNKNCTPPKRANGLIGVQKSEKNGKRKDSGSFSEDDSTDEPAKEEKQLKPQNLFRGFKMERVCQICEKPGDLIRCKGPCLSYFHLPCVKPDENNSDSETESEEVVETNEVFQDVKIIKQKIAEEREKLGSSSDNVSGKEEEHFKCIDCLSGVAPACFICQGREGDRIRCSSFACGKYYHVDCFKLWPQAHWQGGRLTCPYHVCHTCISDNPQNNHNNANSDKLVKCVRCPSTYHASISCVPAGSTILTSMNIVCPKHLNSPQPPINTTWCFLCTQGGTLICCDTCPMSFHAECLSIKPPEGGYICEDCETGRLPLYGEIIWAKLGNYRWWPSIVCYPDRIPDNIAKMNHIPGEFCIMFFGSNDYKWINRGRVFLYQEGDAKVKTAYPRTITNMAYETALEVAQKEHLKFKMNRELMKSQVSQKIKPPRYVKLRSNKPYGNVKIPEPDSIVACNCNPKSEKPCAADAKCINRMLFFECSIDVCPAGQRCQNQDFQNCNYPNMKPFHTDGRGWGLKTLEKIRQGQFVVEYVGEIIDEAEYKRRLQRKRETKNENFYFLTIDMNRMIDAEPKGNLSRFMNHSCQPNCETQKWTVNGDTRIGLFALRDIQKGEELTFNYQLQSDGEDKKPCLCGAPNCSGFIGLKATKFNGVNGKKEKKDVKEEVDNKEIKKESEKKIRGRKPSCFSCGCMMEKNEEIVRCTEYLCNKQYHKSCLKLRSMPFNYICPHHKCVECNKRSLKRCYVCCVSWCMAHYSSEKRRQHKMSHDDRWDTDNESRYSNINNNSIDENRSNGQLIIEELPPSDCSTPIAKSKDSSAKKPKKDKHKNLKTPLSMENSMEKSKTKPADEKNDSNLKEIESKTVAAKRPESRMKKKVLEISKEISDTENQSPPKVKADFPRLKRKAKSLSAAEESTSRKKTETKKDVEKLNHSVVPVNSTETKKDAGKPNHSVVPVNSTETKKDAGKPNHSVVPVNSTETKKDAGKPNHSVVPVKSSEQQNQDDKSSIKMDDDMMLQMFFDTSTVDEEMACKICKKSQNLEKCNGACNKYFHESCANPKTLRRNGYLVSLNDTPKLFKCNDCLQGVIPSCNLCNKLSQQAAKCNVANCNNYYHSSCLQSWPQAQTIKGKSICPQHVCHTCSVKNLLNGEPLTLTLENLHKCIRCYTSYHSYPWCIPTGSIIVSKNAIICPKHISRNKPNNLTWCFQCSNDEADIRCTECPVAYHKDCLDSDKITTPFLCNYCKFGKLPLYNEVVWVKINFSYDCWPAVVCANSSTPFKLLEAKCQPGEFCVHFLEANKYSYVGRESIIPFNGDSDVDIVKARANEIEELFLQALTNAQTASKQFENMQKKMTQNIPKLPEPVYETLFTNVYKNKLESPNQAIICNCNPQSENPCGPGSDCKNRGACVECNPATCPARSNCRNQLFSKRQYLTVEKFCTDNRGWGLRAMEPAIRGDFVIEFVGNQIMKKTMRKRITKKTQTNNQNCYYLQLRNRVIDAELRGNLARFINHSCDPNCVIQEWTVSKEYRLGIFAMRDLRVGEELTINYKVLSVNTRIPCLCGTSKCTGFLGLTKEQVEMDKTLNGDADNSITADSESQEEEGKPTSNEKRQNDSQCK